MKDISAVVAAAGRSTRMGEPKQLLPWGNSTVIETVVRNLASAGAAPVAVIVGHQQVEVRKALRDTSAWVIENHEYQNMEMLRSFQIGVQALQKSNRDIIGTLLALGDQPHIPADVIAQVVEHALQTPDKIVIPSCNMRRGHPFYLPRRLWSDLLALRDGQTMRQIMRRSDEKFAYVNVTSDAILRDMDTPAQYGELSEEFDVDQSITVNQ